MKKSKTIRLLLTHAVGLAIFVIFSLYSCAAQAPMWVVAAAAGVLLLLCLVIWGLAHRV